MRILSSPLSCYATTGVREIRTRAGVQLGDPNAQFRAKMRQGSEGPVLWGGKWQNCGWGKQFSSLLLYWQGIIFGVGFLTATYLVGPIRITVKKD